MAMRKLKPIEERDPYAAAVLDAFDKLESVRGSHIPATLRHDAGAYARCSYCGLYSDRIEALNEDKWPCECGKLHGWSGSFVPPTADSQWSEVTPNITDWEPEKKSGLREDDRT